MSRRHRAEKREINPDPKYGDLVLTKFMNAVMLDGKKSVAERIALKPKWRQRLGLAKAVPHRNRSPRADYQSYYTDRSAEFVATHFAPEITSFDYKF